MSLARSRIESIEFEVLPRPRKRIYVEYFETPVVRNLLERFGKCTNSPAVKEDMIIRSLPPVPIDVQPPFPDAEMTKTV